MKLKKVSKPKIICHPGIGDTSPDPHCARRCVEQGGPWFAYQNQNPRHEDYQHMVFVMAGHHTFPASAPTEHPPREDLRKNYVLVGKCDPKARTVTPL